MDYSLKSPETNKCSTTWSLLEDTELGITGEEVQRLCVIQQLLQLIQADEQGCMQRVFPKIQQALNTASTEFHIETARAFVAILDKKAIHYHAFSSTFLPSILYHIDNRDPVVSNVWLETLLEVSELLPTEIVKEKVLHVAINKGQISQSVWHRVAACKLLGKMCTRFDQHTVKKDVLPIVHSLCQDVNESVRACICSQLHRVARGLPQDMVKPALIPILVELGRDETVQVRVEATETIVHMIPYLSPDVVKATIIPLVKKICEQAVLAMDDTLVTVAKQFGSLCIGLESCLTVGEKLWMVTYYHNMSHLGIPSHGGKKDIYFTSHNMDRINARYIECRQLCAYNFPAMAKFCAPNTELLEKLFPSFCDFSTDPYYMVRKTIGAGIHEVARILGSNNRVVKNQIMTLLRDSMEEVLMGIVPHLGRTIDLLVGSGVLGQEQDGAAFELGRGLMQCDKTIRDKTHNWRLYADFIAQLESVVKCLPSDYIYTHFVTLMFDKMHHARPLPCRLAAARTLLVYLRHNSKNNQRQEIRARLQAEFCLSSSCYKRMLFLRLCDIAREIFSRSYFKEHFFYLLLSRSEDKVANNRLLLVRQFPYLKAMIIMPSEKKYLQQLECCVRNMVASEKDKDVSAELRRSVARLDKTETLSKSSDVPTIEDVEDREKLDREVLIANAVPRPGAGIAVTLTDDRRGGPREIKRQRSNRSKINEQIPTVSGAPTSTTTTTTAAAAASVSPGRQERNYGGGAAARKSSPVSSESSSAASQSSTSKNFEEDFYRDAGVKANEIMSRKFSGIPVYDKPQISSPKISSSVTNKRRTWFATENSNRNDVSLDSSCKYQTDDKYYSRKKSETLPSRESLSLEKIGIGPRSKSFVLPSTLIYSEQEADDHQSTKLVFEKPSVKDSDSDRNDRGALRKFRAETDSDRFGFRVKHRDKSRNETEERKSFPKTKIPVGRNSSPNGSGSSNPGGFKDKSEVESKSNLTKKPISTKHSVENEIKNVRTSLDSNNTEKGSFKRKSKEKSKNDEDKTEDVVIGSSSSRLPVRRTRTEK